MRRKRSVPQGVNSYRGETSFEVDGVHYFLVYGLKELAQLEEIWGCNRQPKDTAEEIVAKYEKFTSILDHPSFDATDLSSLRCLYSGGAPLPTWIAEAYQRRGLLFKQGFGMTEVGVNCFAMTVEESARRKGSIGKPLMFTETRLVDDEGREVPPGQVGELWLRGPHVCRGYWNDPEATAAALDADGWFHTGDLARRDAEGFHYIAGRRKDMFISGGVNVYPAEIEAALLLHPDVQDTAVIGAPHPVWGEAGVAFVVARPGHGPTADTLSAHLAERLAKYKIPRIFQFVDELPRTPYGKVVKADLQERFARSGEASGQS